MIYPHSQIWTPETIHDIHSRASGAYRLGGFRPLRDVPTFDELTFLAAGLTRFPLEGYKERCNTETSIGKAADKPLVLDTPIYLHAPAEMGADVLREFARASGQSGTALSSARTVDEQDRKLARNLVLELPAVKEAPTLISKVREVGAIQLNVQPETTSETLRDVVASTRKWTGKRIPILVGFGASRIGEEVRAVVKAGADGIVIEGQQTRTAHSPGEMFQFCRVPTIAAIPMARDALLESKALGAIDLVVATGVRDGADAAKALALGADAVRIDVAALIALGFSPGPHASHVETSSTMSVAMGAGIKVAKFINSMTMEMALLARSLGKGDVHSLEFEDLSALTLEASMMAGVRLAGE